MWHKTKHRGIRYKKHKTRKHGIKFDRYFYIRYTLDGKQKEEGLGWSTEGMSAEKAMARLVEIKEAIKLGKKGPITHAERKAEAKSERIRKKTKALSFSDFATETYFKHPDTTAKSSLIREKGLFTNWVKPVMGAKRLIDVGLIDCERLKSNMMKAKQSPRSVEYGQAITRQIINLAIAQKKYHQNNPAGTPKKGGTKKPKYDNRRLRFLSNKEAKELLAALKEDSETLYNISLISLYCGFRFGEIAKLKWSDVDLANRMLTIRDTKNTETRIVYMTENIKAMFSTLKPGKPSGYVFLNALGVKYKEPPTSFARVVLGTNLNDGIDDRRQKVTFHTLRHTCISWLAQAGVGLEARMEFAGHKTPAMGMRYSHLEPNSNQRVAMVLEEA